MATLLGPLTTTFTPPSDCNWFSVNIVDYQNTLYTNIWKYFLDWPSPGRCFPNGFPTSNVDPGDYYYSPGICPSGWTRNQDLGQTRSDSRDRCCPPGFTLFASTSFYTEGATTNSLVDEACYITVTAPTTVSAVILTGTDFDTYRTGPSAGSPVTLATSTDYVIQTDYIYMSIFEVRYKSGDFDNTPHTASSTTSQLSSSAVATPISSPSKLSTGAKIGIGIGIPLAVLTLAILTFCVFYRRRKRSDLIAGAINNGGIHDDYPSKPELPGSSYGEVDGEVYNGKPELETISTQVISVAELPETQHFNLPHELHGQDSISVPDKNVKTDNSGKVAMGAVEQGTDTSTIPPTALSSKDDGSRKPGPLPSPSELFPSINNHEEDLDEEELRYQEQRLKERRELLAEKESLAIEEDRLRRIRAKKG